MCLKLFSNQKPVSNVSSYPALLTRHGGLLVDLCKSNASSSTNNASKEQFLSIGKSIEDNSAKLKTELKSQGTDPFRLMDASKNLLDTLEKFLQHYNSPKFPSQPAKIEEEGLLASKDIVKHGCNIIDSSCSMIDSVKSLVINPKDPPTWQTLANTSKEVSDAIKKLISEVEAKAPGKVECEEAVEKLTSISRELNNASLAANNKNLDRRQDKNIKQFTEQIQNAVSHIKDQIPAIKVASKLEVEKLGHSVNEMVSYFEPLSTNAIQFAENMVNPKQQVLLLDTTKKACYVASDLLNSAKDCGGNYKATHLHQDIDEQSDSLENCLEDLIGLVNKLAPNMGVMSNIVNSVTEAVRTVEKCRPDGTKGSDGGAAFATVQTDMMTLTKAIARKCQEVVVQSTKNPEAMGELAVEMSKDYQDLASHLKTAINSVSSGDIGKNLRLATSELGKALTELIKSTGACQSSPKDSSLLREVSENARSVTQKVGCYVD